MKLPISWTIITALFFLASATPAAEAAGREALTRAPGSSCMLRAGAALSDSARNTSELLSSGCEAGSKWVVDRADNICGLDDAKMLSKPAKVDYDALLKATTEMKKIRDDKIDSSSPEGIRLRQAAVDRVRSAADKVRVAEGYCSVWKEIRHQDGRTIPDITDLVKAQL
jgi:hypothetical protein